MAAAPGLEEGLRINPCVPGSWGDYEVVRRFRGKTVTVRVTNPRRRADGVASVAVNGAPLDLPADDKRGALVPVDAFGRRRPRRHDGVATANSLRLCTLATTTFD